MDYKYYLFDLDGTLTDPGIGITNSVMYALEKFGIHVSNREELYPFIGPPLVDSFKKYFGLMINRRSWLLIITGSIFAQAVFSRMRFMKGYLKCCVSLRTGMR